MAGNFDGDDDLVRDIGFALSRTALRPKGHISIEACRLAARAVVEHLKRSNWRFTKGPQSPPHTTYGGHKDGKHDG